MAKLEPTLDVIDEVQTAAIIDLGCCIYNYAPTYSEPIDDDEFDRYDG